MATVSSVRRAARSACAFALCAAIGTAVAEPQGFPSEWRNSAFGLLTSSEAQGYVVPRSVACKRNPGIDCAGDPDQVFLVVPDEVLIERLVRSLHVKVGEEQATPTTGSPVTLVFSVPTERDKELRAVTLEARSKRVYEIAESDLDVLAKWLLRHVERMDAGEVVVERVEGLDQSVAFRVVFGSA